MHLRSGGSSKEEEKSLNQILCTQAIQIGILSHSYLKHFM